MEKCHYEKVETRETVADADRKIYFFRQLLICSGVWTCYFQSGLCFGAPTVVIPQLMDDINIRPITEDMTSWLSAAYNLGGFPWITLLPLFAKHIGRRLCYIMVSINTFAAFLIFYFSSTVNQLLISQTMQGMVNASTVTLLLIITTEYTSPKHRGIFLTLKTATFGWGLWVSNLIGTFTHWKNIGIVGIICSIYVLLTALLWPESPYWLSSKRRFDKCSEAQRWLKGFGPESDKELQSLLKLGDIKDDLGKDISCKDRLKEYWNLVKSKQFYKPILLCMLILAQYNFSGKLLCSIYAIEILKNITNTEATAYTGMLIIDGITVAGTYIGCALASFVQRRTLLLNTSLIGILFLFLISLYLYLIHLSIIAESKYASIALLIGFSLSISCGPMILATSICGELLPLKSRTFSTILIGSSGNILLGTLVKMSPYIFKMLDMHGAFLFYGISTSICSVFIYMYLPETKNKTLQEIEDCIIKSCQ